MRLMLHTHTHTHSLTHPSTRCLAPCGDRPRLADYRCVWCQKTVHEDCVLEMEEGLEERCNLGPHQTMIIPPSSITLAQDGWRGRKRCENNLETSHSALSSPLPSLSPSLSRLVVKAIIPPAISEWRPLVVMANPRSGGNDGPKVLSAFRKLLNPIQVQCTVSHAHLTHSCISYIDPYIIHCTCIMKH